MSVLIFGQKYGFLGSPNSKLHNSTDVNAHAFWPYILKLRYILYFFPCSESDDNEEKPEVTITPSVSTNSILKPEDYSKFGMPSGYIFWPTANVFVHPTGQLILECTLGVFKLTKKPTQVLLGFLPQPLKMRQNQNNKGTLYH